MAEETVVVPGSERAAVPGAQRVGDLGPDERVEVTLVVRARAQREQTDAQPDGHRAPRVQQRRYLSRAEFAGVAGADAADLERVTRFAAEHGLEVLDTSAARRTVRLAGAASAISAAFGVQLGVYEHSSLTFRGRLGPVHLPADVVDVVEAVLGLDERPQASTRHKVARAATAASVTAAELARLYDFPTGVDGSGQCVAIIELGGGYHRTDLHTYFRDLGISAPTVVAVGVDGAKNAPTGNADGPDGEVLLDIEVVGAVAPGARIAVYFAPNTDAGFLDAVTTAVHDTVHAPSVISISWGGAESQWTEQAARAMDSAFADAGKLGVSVCVASGDNGAADRVDDGLAHADFPASSPHVLGCGGTVVHVAGGAITSETVWNDGSGGASGGGISDLFDLPDYQQGAAVPPSVNPGGRIGRGVPDVSGDADPATGYRVVVDGQQMVIGGTSAVAPLWAGLLALVNQSLGKPVGQVNPLLYAALAPAPDTTAPLVDITSGDNRVGRTSGYEARAGWDPCTGLGRPDGSALLRILST